MNESKQLATRSETQLSIPDAGERGVKFSSLAEMSAFAQAIVNSGLAPSSFKNSPDAILVAMQHGMELGLSPLAALNSIAVINGRPTLYGDGLMAVARAHPECEDIIETFERGEGDENMKAICEVKRKGCIPVVRTFSVAQAKKAALWGKSGPWLTYPQRMLQMRARGFALRDAFADALKGFRMAEEERDIEPRQVQARVVRTELVLPGDEPNTEPEVHAQHEQGAERPLSPMNDAGEFVWEGK